MGPTPRPLGRAEVRPPPHGWSNPDGGERRRPWVILWAPTRAGVAKLADARDSKSREAQVSCGFDSHLRHHSTRSLPSLARGKPLDSVASLPRSWQAIRLGRVAPSLVASHSTRSHGSLAHGEPMRQSRMVP